jgi:hypothetical protein
MVFQSRPGVIGAIGFGYVGSLGSCSPSHLFSRDPHQPGWSDDYWFSTAVHRVDRTHSVRDCWRFQRGEETDEAGPKLDHSYKS